MYRKAATLFAVALIAFASSAFASEVKKTPQPLFTHYETVRQALLHDHLEGVDKASAALSEEAKKLAGKAEKGKNKETLVEIADSASKMALAKEIETVRETFGGLSRAMVRYRETVDGDRPVVAFCSMANKPWLQPEGEIGNPYYGQSMAKCGEIVSWDED